jgi:hypothetical protein
MQLENEPLPQAVTSSPGGEPAIAPAVSIVPEKLAEHTEALGHAMMELMVPPAADPREAVEAFSHRLGDVSQSLELIYQDANDSMHSLSHAAEEAFRRHYELGLHLLQDLAVAKGPAEAVRLQFAFLSAQSELFVEQSKELQRHFAQILLPPKAKTAAEAAIPEDTALRKREAILRP